tara:strand:- start:481 stop:831 length:351 start_codon:yes stop_codon:yes gene_type:complete
MTKILEDLINGRGYPKNKVHLKRIKARYWNDENNHSKGIEEIDHLFISLDKKLWKEINNKLLFKDIDDYNEVKEFMENLSLGIHENFFLYRSRLTMKHKSKVLPKIEIIEEDTVYI